MSDKELQEFLAKHKESIERLRRVDEAAQEDMADLAQRKTEHPELYDADRQLEITARFVADNPDLSCLNVTTPQDDE